MGRFVTAGCLSIGALLGGLACAGPAREAPPAERETPPADPSVQGGVHTDRRFSGFVRIRTSAGVDSVRVELSNLDLHGRTTVDRLELPFEGTLVAYIQAGTATTVTDGKRQERSQGQIWTVPPGASLGLTTGRDAASLQMVLVGTGRP
jgi:hypothetical protein